MKEKKIIYFQDELNDEFSGKTIKTRIIDGAYKYKHNLLWDFFSVIFQNVITEPFKFFYTKIKFRIKYIGKEKLKKYKNTGYFVYVNHTQQYGDIMIPTRPIYPKRNFFIVNPENVSMKGLKNFVELCGAIPVPANKEAMKNFLDVIEYRIRKKSSITIYPEAHIWPFYTKIRPFKSVSFSYPAKLEKPSFCMTNTYQKYGKDKYKIVTYIDGPFFVNKDLSTKEQKEDLRNRIYNCMVDRSKNSNYEHIRYVKKSN